MLKIKLWKMKYQFSTQVNRRSFSIIKRNSTDLIHFINLTKLQHIICIPFTITRCYRRSPLDCHSLLQIALGTCTWAINYKTRPFALTTVILCCSITVNITAGVLISVGDHRTRKKDVLEKMFKQDLTREAIHKMEKRREKEKERNGELDAEDRVEADFKGAHEGTDGAEKKKTNLETEDGK
ncbi:hypothetical protein EYC84_004795 [Monilinia fructicola]|uniref:Uncharacterized protein n=1 Tax=Monilinia fructicola TaxID=38448 RepID=A0A5M9K1K0_MONFR|nr:hypothetical protein EYC84_004795 [Monilinia fructicola]